MTYTIADINRAVSGFQDTPAAWAEFQRLLLRNESVALPGVGHAYLEERNEASTDSYGYTNYDDIVWFIFKVTSLGEPERFFKKSGCLDSYDDNPEFDGATVEVEKVPTTGYTWKETR